jgi:predicted phosphodiesterase
MSDSAADKADRVAREADMIADAEASILAGDVISHDQFRIWSDNLLTNPYQSHPPPS